MTNKLNTFKLILYVKNSEGHVTKHINKNDNSVIALFNFGLFHLHTRAHCTLYYLKQFIVVSQNVTI